jgi:CHASE2 domain-containing sensor protein
MLVKTILSKILHSVRSWPAVSGLLLLVTLHLFGAIPYQETLRTFSFDLYLMAFPRERVSAPVMIVDIDEESLKKYGQWPWPRSLVAQLLARVLDMDPAAVAFDIIMPEPDRTSPCQITKYMPGIDQALVAKVCALPGNDALLAKQISKGNVVLGVAGIDQGSQHEVRAPPMQSIGPDPKNMMRHFNSALTNVEELDAAANGHAILSADVERGVVRKIPLIASVGNTVLPALSLEMLRLASGNPSFIVKSSDKGIESVGVKDLSIPTQADGSIWVHFSPHDPTRFISAALILEGKLDAEIINRKLVLIGFSGLGLVDFPSTALGERVPGVEIHAQILESIFDGTTLQRPGWALWVEAVLMIVLGLLVALAFPNMRASLHVVILLAVTAALIAGGLLIFRQYHLLVDVASPTLLFIVMYGATLTDSLIREEIQLKALEDDLRKQREQAAKAQGEMEAAMRFQMGILPNASLTFRIEHRVDIAAKIEPAKMVGGDLYDCFMLDEHRLFFSVGDVCGKGIAASLFMVISKTLCKSVAMQDDMQQMDVGELVRKANLEISRDNSEMLFVTAFIGILDLRTGMLNYCNAGHEKPLLAAAGCHPKELSGLSGPPISTWEDFEYKTHSYRLSSQEFLCIFTDGATEAFNLGQEEFGRPRLIELLSNIEIETNADSIIKNTFSFIHNFVSGADPSDDLTMMVIKWKS